MRRVIHLSRFVLAKRHIARINAAGNIVSGIQVLRMTSKLIPLAFNELLCRPVILSFNCRSKLPSLRCIQLGFRFDAERHNARINPRRASSTQFTPKEEA
jgi:hypothetical protein